MVFVLTLIFLAFFFIRPQDFIGGPLTGERVVLVILGITLGMWLPKMIIRREPLIKKPQDIFMLGLFVAVVISTLSVKWSHYTIDTSVQFSKAVLLYFLTKDILDSPGRFKVFLWTMAVCVFIVGIFGIMQYYGHDVMGIAPFVGLQLKNGVLVELRRIRGIGLFDTNQLAYLMGFILPFAYALFRLTKVLLLKICLVVFAIIFALTTYLTLSRGGMVAFAVAVVFLYLLRKGFSNRILGIIIAVISSLFLASSTTRLGTISGFETDANFQGRLMAWYMGFQGWKNNPLVGIGANMFTDTFKVAAHNAIVQVVVETGLFGFFFWLGLLYFTFLSLRRIMLRYKDAPESWVFILAFCLLVSFFQFFISCCFSNVAAYSFYTFIYVGIVVALERYSIQAEAQPQEAGALVRFKDIIRIFWLIVITLVIWKVVLVLYLD